MCDARRLFLSENRNCNEQLFYAMAAWALTQSSEWAEVPFEAVKPGTAEQS